MKDLEEPAEESWVEDQRTLVRTYIDRQDLRPGRISDWPAWHIHPYLAIWAIESAKAPRRVGWWVISGDVPTDYVSSIDASDPREVMRHFAQQWHDVATHMLRGQAHPAVSIGPPEQWPAVGDLLRRRAQLLGKFADDDSIWASDEL
jgi:hypothetical protein